MVQLVDVNDCSVADHQELATHACGVPGTNILASPRYRARGEIGELRLTDLDEGGFKPVMTRAQGTLSGEPLGHDPFLDHNLVVNIEQSMFPLLDFEDSLDTGPPSSALEHGDKDGLVQAGPEPGAAGVAGDIEVGRIEQKVYLMEDLDRQTHGGWN